MRFSTIFGWAILGCAILAKGVSSEFQTKQTCLDKEETPANNCISFSVGSGTGCQWMCNYCEQSLGTTNYYFTDGVCKYQTGGCVGSPQLGKTYTCCSA